MIVFKEQPYKSMQCGQTCLSMITGKSIDEICEELGKFWTTHLDSDLQSFLERNGYKTKLVGSGKIEFDEIPNDSLVRICFPSGNGHIIIKHDDKYYDPSVGIVQQMLAYVRVTHYLTFKKEQNEY